MSGLPSRLSVPRSRLRCGACGRFVTIDNLDRHIDNDCPIKYEEEEEAA